MAAILGMVLIVFTQTNANFFQAVVGTLLLIVAPTLIIIGAIAGWRAGLMKNDYGFGSNVNLLAGFIGAVISGPLLPQIFSDGLELWFGLFSTVAGEVLIGIIAGWATGPIVRGAEPRSVVVRIVDAAIMLLVGVIVSFFGSLLLFGVLNGAAVVVMEVFVSAFVGGGILLLLFGLPRLLKRVRHA